MTEQYKAAVAQFHAAVTPDEQGAALKAIIAAVDASPPQEDLRVAVARIEAMVADLLRQLERMMRELACYRQNRI